MAAKREGPARLARRGIGCCAAGTGGIWACGWAEELFWGLAGFRGNEIGFYEGVNKQNCELCRLRERLIYTGYEYQAGVKTQIEWGFYGVNKQHL